MFANGGGLRPPQPPRFFKALHACNKTQASCHRRVCCWERLRGSLSLQMGGAAPPPTPPLLSTPSMLAIKKTSCHHHVCSKGRLRGSLRVCKWGGLRPPQTPRFFKALHACNKTQASCHRRVCCWERLRGSLCLQMGGAAPPPTPPLLSTPSMLAIKKHHVITMCAVREGCADHCVFANGGGLRPPQSPQTISDDFRRFGRI